MKITILRQIWREQEFVYAVYAIFPIIKRQLFFITNISDVSSTLVNNRLKDTTGSQGRITRPLTISFSIPISVVLIWYWPLDISFQKQIIEGNIQERIVFAKTCNIDDLFTLMPVEFHLCLAEEKGVELKKENQ